jgi:tetratricopeptide (TPR) repeat protein
MSEPQQWKEIFQEQSSKYYYWNPITNEVNWCIPGSKWRKFKAPETERVYYCHAETGTTVWQLPPGVQVPQSGSRASIASAEGAVLTHSRVSTAVDHPPPTPSPTSSPSLTSSSPPSSSESTTNGSSPPESPAKSSHPLQSPASPKAESKEFVGEEQAEKKEFPESTDPDAQGLKQKGNAHFNRKEFAEAKDCYDNAILLDNTCANFYFNRSAVFYCMSDLINALRDATKAVDLAPDNASALTRLGFTLMKMNPPQYDEAEAVYERALKIDPKNARINKGLAKVKQLKTKT